MPIGGLAVHRLETLRGFGMHRLETLCLSADLVCIDGNAVPVSGSGVHRLRKCPFPLLFSFFNSLFVADAKVKTRCFLLLVFLPLIFSWVEKCKNRKAKKRRKKTPEKQKGGK